MKNGKEILKLPIIWLTVFVFVFGLFQTINNDELNSVVRSDGRGYYAYLPAFFIHHDGSFNQVIDTERKYNKGEQIYLYKDKNGKVYNKYFPGLAVLQSPFFITASAISYVIGQPVDGYNPVFMVLFLLGAFSYFILGVAFFTKVLQRLFPENVSVMALNLIVFVFASPLFYYAIYSPGFTHLYSFALFGAFAMLILKVKDSGSTRNYLMLGLTLGLIFLVRPTNILVVFILPFLLGDMESLKKFTGQLLSQGGVRFIAALGSFMVVASLLFITWKWQTGNWIVWSYNGEGFNFLRPKIVEVLFSYRIGLLLHSPVLILSVIGLLMLLRKDRYRGITFVLYAILNIWVIAAWWCWDYESVFGNRPFTEHMVFLLIPALYLFQMKWKLMFSILTFFGLLGIFRMYQTVTGITPVARYSSSSYWQSLKSFSQDDIGRWNFTESCKPFGEVQSHVQLLNLTEPVIFDARKEFGLSETIKMVKPRTNERYYFTVKLKKRHDLSRFDGVYLVIDATSNDSEERLYRAIDLYNDREEGKGVWSDELIFQGIIHDNEQQFDQVKFYIWNQGGSTFELKDVQYEIEVYKG